MYRPVAVTSSEELGGFCSLPPAHSLSAVARQHPDASWLLLDNVDKPVARCSLWWSQTPPYENHRLGLIGHYSVATGDAAGPLLQLACEQLAAHGCTLAVGPMDGNTWERYRLLTERGPRPLFFLEPDNPDEWPGQFTDHGFSVLAHYFSAVYPDLTRQDRDWSNVAAELAAEGITLRTLDLTRYEEELHALFQLSRVSFRENFLYTPIEENTFLGLYRDLRDLIRPELVILAEQRGRLVGYAFGIPDLLQRQAGGGRIDTVIVKTVAIHPELAGRGFGGYLTARCRDAARTLGYTQAIHALMHEANPSRRFGGGEAQAMRRYALYSRPLGERS